MNNDINKDQINRDIACRSHSAKSDRELYRICPSKLSKRELEDLYFALLENNLELKRTINGQKDRIKVLSAKVQRMSAIQKNTIGREQGCCGTTKAMVNDQRESIADLKKANERMSERIRLLNMRLCSAKQFLKTSPVQPINRYKASTNGTGTLKNSSMSALTSKRSDNNLKTDAVSSQYLDKEVTTTDTIFENEPNEVEKESEEAGVANNGQTSQNDPEKCCENRCKTVMDELKQKIVDLQEELGQSKEAFSVRAARLEEDVALHRQDIRERDARVDNLADQLRAANNNYEDLYLQLSVERRKVAELETRIKAENMSNKVARTIEHHLSNVNESLKPQQEKPVKLLERTSILSYAPFYPADQSSPRSEEPSPSAKLVNNIPESTPETKMSKYSDDSGYLDGKNQDFDDKDMSQVNVELMKRIYYLQAQLDELKASATRESLNEAQIHSSIYENDQVEAKEMVEPTQKPSDPLASCQPKKDVVFESVENVDKDKDTKCEQKKVLPMSTSWPTPWEQATPSASKGTHSLSEELTPSLPTNATVSSELVVRDCTVNKKGDSHNKYQIPGPIPSQAASSVAVKKRIKEMLRNMQKKKDHPGVSESLQHFLREKTIHSTPNEKMCKLSLDGGVPKHDNNEKPKKNADSVKLEDKSALIERNDRVDVQNPSVTTTVPDDQLKALDEVEKPKTLNFDDKQLSTFDACIPKPKDSLELARQKRLEKQDLEEMPGVGLHDNEDNEDIPICVETRTTDADDVLQSQLKGVPVHLKIKENQNGQDNQLQTIDASTITEVLDIKGDEIDLCSHQCRVCRCSGVRRALTMFRSCSGTLRFRTVAVAGGPTVRHCGCSQHAPDHDCGTKEKLEPMADSSPVTQNTYTVTPGADVNKCSRATSPDNTEQEISSLTDLPSERDDKSPRVLSLGEDKATTTYTESTTTSPDNATLSLGEMPGWGLKKQSRVSNVGQETVEASTSRKMEAALQAITEELARCKHLLISQHSQAARPPVAEAGTSPASVPTVPIALHRAPARPSIGDVSTPTCVFTLHIGTLVLSDEAVLNSRNMSLVLTWKFYNQNVSMTRMKAGRVVLFDFSTEYDVDVTDDFLRYLKYEEMPIVICEVDKLGEPFASCTLPLRDALLHTNRRSDMSLALMAGPQMKRALAADALDSGDEMGVLDLWCMLRAGAKLMPTINHTIAKHVLPMSMDHKTQRRPRLLESEIDDEPSNDFRISTDLDMHRKELRNTAGGAPYSSHKNQSMLADLMSRGNTAPVEPSQRRRMSTMALMDSAPLKGTISASATPKATIDNLYLDPTPQKSSIDMHSGQWKGSDQLASRILLNEVPANIKSTEEMKRALERNVQESHMKMHPVIGLPKVEDELSQVTSIGSMMKLAFAKKQLHKTKWTPRNSFNGEGELSRRMSKDTPHRPNLHDDDDLNIANMRKTGLIKDSKKSVTILPEHSREENQDTSDGEESNDSLSITILWLALNEECEAMVNPRVQRLYVAYSFLGHSGAELETPVSLPKPRHYIEKCYFNFKKTFQLQDSELPLLGHMARCRSGSRDYANTHDSIIFTVISEPPEDPLGLESCEDIGSAQLFLGDVVAFSGDSSEYTEVVPVRAAGGGAVLGVLAVRVAGLALLRRCLALSHSHQTLHW